MVLFGKPSSYVAHIKGYPKALFITLKDREWVVSPQSEGHPEFLESSHQRLDDAVATALELVSQAGS